MYEMNVTLTYLLRNIHERMISLIYLILQIREAILYGCHGSVL